MAVILARIDDRLVHGQVVEGWMPLLDVNEVLVVSAAIAGDEMRKTLMRLSLPEDTGFEAMDSARAAQYLAGEGKSNRTLLLTAGPKEMLELLQNGLALESINVGGMHYVAGKTQIGRAIFVDDSDISYFRAISGKGVKIEGRGVPTDSPLDVMSALGK